MGSPAQQRSGATAARNETAQKAAIGETSSFPVSVSFLLSLPVLLFEAHRVFYPCEIISLTNPVPQPVWSVDQERYAESTKVLSNNEDPQQTRASSTSSSLIIRRNSHQIFFCTRSNATRLSPSVVTAFDWVSDVLVSAHRASSSRARRCRNLRMTSSGLPELKSDGWDLAKNVGRRSIAAPRLDRPVAAASCVTCPASIPQSWTSSTSANLLLSPPARWPALRLLQDSRQWPRLNFWNLPSGRIPHCCRHSASTLKGSIGHKIRALPSSRCLFSHPNSCANAR